MKHTWKQKRCSLSFSISVPFLGVRAWISPREKNCFSFVAANWKRGNRSFFFEEEEEIATLTTERIIEPFFFFSELNCVADLIVKSPGENETSVCCCCFCLYLQRANAHGIVAHPKIRFPFIRSLSLSLSLVFLLTPQSGKIQER